MGGAGVLPWPEKGGDGGGSGGAPARDYYGLGALFAEGGEGKRGGARGL